MIPNIKPIVYKIIEEAQELIY